MARSGMPALVAPLIVAPRARRSMWGFFVLTITLFWREQGSFVSHEGQEDRRGVRGQLEFRLSSAHIGSFASPFGESLGEPMRVN